jgi:hypothetical protein
MNYKHDPCSELMNNFHLVEHMFGRRIDLLSDAT